MTYDRGGGISFAEPRMQEDFRNALSGYDQFHGTNFSTALPRNADGVLNLLVALRLGAFRVEPGVGLDDAGDLLGAVDAHRLGEVDEDFARAHVEEADLDACSRWAVEANALFFFADSTVREPFGKVLVHPDGSPPDELALVPFPAEGWARQARSEAPEPPVPRSGATCATSSSSA